MSPAFVLDGDVLGRARSLPHYMPVLHVAMTVWSVLWLVGLERTWEMEGQ